MAETSRETGGGPAQAELSEEAKKIESIFGIYNPVLSGIDTAFDSLESPRESLSNLLHYSAGKGTSIVIKKALVYIKGPTVNGTLVFTQADPQAPVQVQGSIAGLTAGPHGLHVHQFGNLSVACNGTGAHYNPENRHHGAPVDQDRHVGDLGNVNAGQDGIANVNLDDCVLSLNGKHSIIGRAVVVHKTVDDLGKGNNEESKKSGNAGLKIGCGVIGIAAEN